MDLFKHIGKTKQANSFFSNVAENPLNRYYQHSHYTRRHSRFSKRELSSTLSIGGIHGHGFMSTSNIATTMRTGISQQTLHPSSSASSFPRNSLKIELLTPTVVKFYPTFSMK
jgi:hypothetical protein